MPEPDYSQGAAYVDGQLVPIAEAKISLLDWGFLHSDATYDVAHVWKGAFFRVDDHISRFFASMEKLRLSISYDREQVRNILVDCVRAADLRDTYVEMICTRGLPQAGSRDPRSCTNRFFAFAIPFVWIADPERQKRGLHLSISQRQRIAPESVDPKVKNYHWLDLVMGLFEAYERGGETVVLLDTQGNVVEGPGFNVFAVRGRTIRTPGRGMLEGITRRTAIELAQAKGYDVIQIDLSPAQVHAADEVFITSTAGGIIGITRIDGRLVGNGHPGPVTEELRAAYWDLHDDPQYALLVDYG